MAPRSFPQSELCLIRVSSFSATHSFPFPLSVREGPSFTLEKKASNVEGISPGIVVEEARDSLSTTNRPWEEEGERWGKSSGSAMRWPGFCARKKRPCPLSRFACSSFLFFLSRVFSFRFPVLKIRWERVAVFPYPFSVQTLSPLSSQTTSI